MIENEKDFIDWLDCQLDEEIPNNIIAFNINIYESPFNIEIVGSTKYDPEDEDWACNEDWTPQSRLSQVSKNLFGNTWEVAESKILSLAKGYIKSNAKNTSKLKTASAFTVGFIDGNLKHVL